MSKSLYELAAEMVTAQASHVAMTPDEMAEAITKAYQTLASIKAMEETGDAPEVETEPADEVPEKLLKLREAPLRSIRQKSVVCLECGAEFKMLTNKHLEQHGMTANEYRAKYGMKKRQPLSCKSLSADRAKVAKEKGLADKLVAARNAKKADAKKAKAPKKKAAPKADAPAE
ncbi:transcriptional regulator, MucR family [Desulfatibacillum alkenivorans DSM 16219]|jgi:predicted transcriptional regulator|uniref:Transcriptional regulator, MucR family n=1 Tax=Desulfatibacillum alkenivorans DSM 16219 TaxID=1121393 RepID=A0A1M6LN69_9BACT|nr:MucR family transcriptional regulator [Desulfatibacillum alkenivorans]SHJ72593.1 transcriptional regulator, MucR family [Desulfatibacillum alkenivorans DSM 16219]